MTTSFCSTEEIEKTINGLLPSAAKLLLKRLQNHKATYLHSLRVACLCRRMAQETNQPKEIERKWIASAVLHEVGILQTIAEYEIPDASIRTIEQWNLSAYVDDQAILQQGENLDGTGFPRGLTWKEISMFAKVLRVADSFDRMTVSPLGNSLLSAPAALSELYRWNEVLFDPHSVACLQRVLGMKKQHSFVHASEKL